VEDMLNKHFKGTHNFTGTINTILTLEFIQRKLFEDTL
jgi:hypothetical protein